MPSLPETLTSDTKKAQVVDDCCGIIDAEVSDKGGFSGLAIKAGYAAVKGIKPGFVDRVVGIFKGGALGGVLLVGELVDLAAQGGGFADLFPKMFEEGAGEAGFVVPAAFGDLAFI